MSYLRRINCREGNKKATHVKVSGQLLLLDLNQGPSD